MRRAGNTQRQVRIARRIFRIFALVFIAVFAVFIHIWGNFYKEFKVVERNTNTGNIGKRIDSYATQFVTDKKREMFTEHREKALEKSDEKGEAFMKGDITMEDIQKESEESMKEFNDISSFGLKGEYYVFGTVDKDGCYAEPCELFEERERIVSVDPSEVPYNWAVYIKDGKAVEAWTSKETLTEADMKPYTKEEQIKQYGSLVKGSADNVTGYWHTTF